MVGLRQATGGKEVNEKTEITPPPPVPPLPPSPPTTSTQLQPSDNKKGGFKKFWSDLPTFGKVLLTAGTIIVLIIIGVAAGTGAKKENNSTTTEVSNSESASSKKSTQTSEQTAPPVATNPPAPAATNPPAPAQPEVRTLTGNGNQATQAFSLGGGLVVFHMQGTSSGNFAVELMDQATGQETALLANVIGNYAGSQAVGVDAGTYLFNVTSEGPWSIGIEEPNPTTAPSTPQTFSGSGPLASGFFTASNGLATFAMSHQGDGNFAVQVLDTDGNQIGLPANEIGVYQGSQAVSLNAGDIYILNIEANGAWSVQVQ